MSRQITTLGIQASIKEFVERSTGIPTHIRRDGMEPPKVKPYVIVTPLPTTSYALSKGKEAIRTHHAMQLDVYGKSKYEISAIQAELSDLVMFGRFPYFTEDGEETTRLLEFEDDVIESPIFSDDLSKTSSHHSVHIGVNVIIVRHKRRGMI